MSQSIQKVRVTLTTEVLGVGGEVLTSTTRTTEESGGNPLYTTRMAHRAAERCADETRAMLQTVYGEVDANWRVARAEAN